MTSKVPPIHPDLASIRDRLEVDWIVREWSELPPSEQRAAFVAMLENSDAQTRALMRAVLDAALDG